MRFFRSDGKVFAIFKVNGHAMKRLLYILALLMLVMPVKAQDEPKALTFSHTVYYPGMNGLDISWRAREWLRSRPDRYTNVTLFLRDCPNFGVSEFLGGGPTEICMDIYVVAKDNAYTIYATNIEPY